VRHTGHNANSASTSKTGLLATLRAVLHVQGSGAGGRALDLRATNQVSLGRPIAVKTFTRNKNNSVESRNSRQARTPWAATNQSCVASFKHAWFSLPALVFASLALAFAVPALAAAPETPSPVTVESVKASEATFRGVLNPTKEGGPGTYELGTYEFLYRKSPTECKGQGKAPEPAGISLGGGMEGVSAVVGGLEPGTEYSVCLLVRNGTKGEAAVGPIEHFTTAIPPAAETLPAQNVTGTTAKLEGVLNPHTKGEAGTYTFVYQPNPTACQGTEQHETPAEPEGSAAGETPEPESQEVTGLLPNTTYTYCLRAINSVGEVAVGNPQTFTTLAVAPAVTAESESATNVGSSSATLSAQVDPGGAATTFFFEYGPTVAYGSTTPVESAGAGSQPVAVRATLSGLTPDTQYHFRVVTSNAKGPADGADATFSTLPASTLGLPDGRGYELVSPLANGNNEEVLPLYGKFSPIRAAADGGALAYLATPPAEGGNGHGGSPDPGASVETNYNEFLARRSLAGGWTAADIQPPGLEEAIYGSVSSDLATGILASPEPVTAGVPPAGYGVLYSRAGDGSYRPLFTKTPSHRSAKEFSAAYAGISADSRHVLYSANDALLEGAGPQAKELNTDVKQGLETQAKEYEEANKQEEEEMFALANITRALANERAPRVLYDAAAGGLNVVDVLPDGELAGTAVFGSEVEFSRPEAVNKLGSGNDLGHVISADGSRVIWTATEAVVAEGDEGAHRGVTAPRALYVRENDTQPQSPISGGECTVSADACTVQVDASALPGTPKEKEEKGGHGTFWTASADGSRVFFTDELPLTSDATAEAGKPDLYEYQVNGEAGRPGTLTDLTASGAEPANVVGVLGASDDGSSVYFAAAGALAPGAQHQACAPYIEEHPGEGGKCNVYVIHDGEAPKLVAAVATGDGQGAKGNSSSVVFYEKFEAEKIGDWVPEAGVRSSRVTPDGSHLLFESVENLTGFDSHGDSEIYLYDLGAGVTCVSCNPSGAPTQRGERFTRAAELPESLNATYATRDLSSNGDRVFFDTAEALVPQDKNVLTDVYEWERDGSGSCAHENGCLYLLSGGTSGDFSAFLDASETGEDVFLATRAQLVPQDQGEQFEAYDARVGAPQQPTPQACTGTGCQGVPAAPPVFATPSSATFNGAGNFPPPPPSKPLTAAQRRAQKLTKALRACAKLRARKKRASCKKSAQRKYGALKATKASNHRRAR
jgi:hypothetical protein